MCICLVIQGDFQSFGNYKGFSIIFPKMLDAIYRFSNERIFDSYLNNIFESENLRFPFSTKDSITCGVKCQKLSFRK